MKKHIRVMLIAAALLFAVYTGAYLYYRIFASDRVLDELGGSDFTFNLTLKGKLCMKKSGTSHSFVSRLASLTGLDVASCVNAAFRPAMRIDHLFTGRHIRFSNLGVDPDDFSPVDFDPPLPPTVPEPRKAEQTHSSEPLYRAGNRSDTTLRGR